ncbi:MAG: AIDA repeat-containing protein, partial [Desulfovibrio sp.]|nr:AIDA repeat-containing protein [Desulfovibrio sp.]
GLLRNTVVSSGGSQRVSAGGSSVSTTVASGGYVYVHAGGLFSGGAVIGTQRVSSGGLVRNVAVTQGGAQIILACGKASNCSAGTGGIQHLSGGVASGTVVRPKGAQRVSAGGSAMGTVVSAGGSQIVSSGGLASGAKILSGGSQHVRLGGVLRGTAVSKGGRQFVSSGGSALSTAVSSGGSVFVYKGAKTSALTVKAGGSAVLHGGALSGVNTFSGATVSVASAGVYINRIMADSSTKVAYDVSRTAASATTAMLIESVKQDLACSFSVTVAKRQEVGAYELSKNLVQSSGTAYAIKLGSTTLGTAKIGGGAISKNGMYYRIYSSGDLVTLKTAAKAGSMLHGGSGNDTLAGTADSDVFWGGAGNDTINGDNGRDVAVYGTGAWGKDVINATDGTMTLLFKDLKASQITSSLSGTTMTFTRAADSAQTVTVSGWSSATHNVVFASNMTAFNTWANAASPTAAQANAARTQVWQKAGLAQA